VPGAGRHLGQWVTSSRDDPFRHPKIGVDRNCNLPSGADVPVKRDEATIRFTTLKIVHKEKKL
jgi:hypothetical protein